MLQQLMDLFRSGGDILLIGENGVTFLVEVSRTLKAEGFENTAISEYLAWLETENKAEEISYPEGDVYYLPVEREEITNELDLYEALTAV